MNKEQYDMNRILWDKDARDRLRKRYRLAIKIYVVLMATALLLSARLSLDSSLLIYIPSAFTIYIIYVIVQLRRIKAIESGKYGSGKKGKPT